jgi:tape measure domain-containing protein
MPELATAWLTLSISADNMQRDIKRELNKIDDGTAKTVGRKIGKQLEQGVGDGAQGAAGQVKARLSERLGAQVGSVVGKGIGAGIKLGLAGAASAAALAVGGVGIALKKGFDRLESIDQAQFKLKALGNDSAAVAKIMDSALLSVKGTAFGLDDAVTAASSAVAAGIKPGEELTKYLKEVGDSAAIAGTNFEDMGSIFNKIQTSNKAYTDDLQQLSDRGLPIFQWLQKEYGVTGEKLSKMVQDGEVDAAHFQAAIDKNIGGAAQKMGQSFDGAVDNMEASVARLGANFITAILGGDPADALGGPTQAITNLTTKFDELGVWVNNHRGEIHGFFVDVKNVANDVGGAIRNITTWLVENKGAAETLAGVFVTWKVISAVAGVVGSLRSMSGLLRTTLPADAAAGAGGISKALSLIVIPEIGKQLTDQIDQWLADNHPDLNRLNHTNTPGDLGRNLRQFVDGSGTDTGTGLPTPQANAPANTRDSGGLPTFVNGLPVAQAAAPAGTRESGGVPVWLPRRASGGSISGPGGPMSDKIPAMLSNGEHVWPTDEVNKVGGQGAMYRLRGLARAGLLKFSEGGAVTVDALKTFASGISGHGYVWGGGAGDTFATDCSGAQSTIANFLTGGAGRFSTGDESTALLSRGFQAGDPPPGISAYWIGWKQGGPGGGHTAGTIVDPTGGNVNVEMGGASGGGAYGSGTGASAFPNRAWIAVAGGDDPSKSNFGGASGGSSSGGGSLPSSSGGGGGGADASSLAGTLLGGLQQSSGFDGSVLSDPTQWPNVKSGIALANFFSDLGQQALGIQGDGMNIGGLNIPGIGGLLKPSGMDALNPIQNLPNGPHQGTGAPPGPTFQINGNVGMDPKAVTDKFTHSQNQAWRKSGLSAVRPG